MDADPAYLSAHAVDYDRLATERKRVFRRKERSYVPSDSSTRIMERDGASPYQCADLVQHWGILPQFLRVAETELGPEVGVATEPVARLSSRRDLLQSAIDRP